MNPTKTIPEAYMLAWSVNMKTDTRLNWFLQLLGMVWFIIVGLSLWPVIAVMRPDFSLTITLDLTGGFIVIIWTLLTIFVTLILHELIHGFFFWLFTREMPRFGIQLGYAYAAAPDWYFPKGKYLIVALAPLVVLTVAGMVAIALAPAIWLATLLLSIVFNAGGAIGDMYICMRIAREAQDLWIKDKGDAFEVYRLRNT